MLCKEAIEIQRGSRAVASSTQEGPTFRKRTDKTRYWQFRRFWRFILEGEIFFAGCHGASEVAFLPARREPHDIW